MESMALWEQIVLGALVVLILLWILPGVRANLGKSREATGEDWRGLLLPLGAVVLFVIVLIAVVAR